MPVYVYSVLKGHSLSAVAPQGMGIDSIHPNVFPLPLRKLFVLYAQQNGYCLHVLRLLYFLKLEVVGMGRKTEKSREKEGKYFTALVK